MFTRFMSFLAVVALALIVSAPASARSRTHLFFGFNAYYPPPYYYYPPPYYYYPPAPVYYIPNAAAAPQQQQTCRRFNGDATIDASGQPFVGTACLQADGKWHIVP